MINVHTCLTSLKKNFIPAFPALCFLLSLLFNKNIHFWETVFNSSYAAITILTISLILLFFFIRKIEVNNLDIFIISLFVFLALNEVFRSSLSWEPSLFNYPMMLIYYLVIRNMGWNKSKLKTYITMCTIGGVLVLIIYIYLESQHIITYYSHWDFSGNFTNPGPLGGLLSLLFMYSLFLIRGLGKTKTKRYFFIVFSALVLVLVMITKSRTAFLGCLIATIILLFQNVNARKKKIWVLLAFMVILILSALALHQNKGIDSLKGRFVMWKISSKMIIDYPILGVGSGRFPVLFPDYQIDYFQSGDASTKEKLLVSFNTIPFNEAILFVAEQGLIGFVILMIVLYQLFKIIKKQRGNMFFLHLAFIISFLVFSSMSYPLWFMPFQLVLIQHIAILSTFDSSRPNIFQSRFVKFLFIPLLLVLLAKETYIISLKNKWKQADLLSYKNINKSLQLYDSLSSKLKNTPSYLFDYGWTITEKNPVKAGEILEASLLVYPEALVYQRLATIYESTEQFNMAEKYLWKNHYANPHFFVPLENLLEFYIRRDNLLKAKLAAKKITEIPIKVKSHKVLNIKTKASDFLKKNEIVTD